jgi:hypothetical protein
MYQGFLAIGNPEGIDEPFREIINNSRAFAYATERGVCWLEEDDLCPETSVILPGGPNYRTPRDDLAPWYDPDNPDTAGFLGVIGLDIVGDESSTMNASVIPTIRPGGVIGPAFYGPRTIVIRCMAIAEDECSLQAGLDWLRAQVTVPMDPCGGDTITFFDCCPCVCTAGAPTGDGCWVTTLDELEAGPECATWWPSTMAEFELGPPAEDETWCDWLSTMRDVETGPNEWSCCVDECVRPYLRQYRNCRVTEGPTMLEHPRMVSKGALAVLEMTLTAADPAEFSLDSRAFREELTPVTVVPEPPAPPVPPTWPFPGHISTIPGSTVPPWFVDVPEDDWVRTFSSVYVKPMGNLLWADRATIIIQSGVTPAPETRIGLWDGDEFIVGYYLPSVPANVTITIDGVTRTITGTVGTTTNPLHDFVRSWDGGIPELDDVPHSVDRLSVDQRPAPGVELTVELRTTGVARP